MTEDVRQSENNGPGDESGIEQRVLSLVETLARELNPKRQVHVSLEASLQRDLGFDSLGLAELVLRAERAFGRRMPDDFIGRLETPLDIVREVAKSGGAIGPGIAQSAEGLPAKTTVAVPSAETTLTGVLEWHARHHPDRPHILLSDGYTETETLTYGDLAQSAGRIAAGMRAWGLEPGERVGIMLPTGREFFEVFFGTLFAGGVPVPMYPPLRMSQLEEHLRRQAGILSNSQAVLLIIPVEGKMLTTLLGAQIDTLRLACTIDDLREPGVEALVVPRQAEDLAMLQYTSGSTGDPKGVMLSHANLLANVRAMGEAIDATSEDVFVSWLPLYHDLGLIGAWFGSLYFAVPVVIMSPLRFIVRPESWLWAIHRNRATISAAPNFAFELCVKKIEDAAIEGLDLSSLRLVANGAEGVSAETLRRFTERFEPYGFRPEAMAPVYGLAENTVGLAFSAVDQLPIIDRVSRERLSKDGVATPAGSGETNPMVFVSSGIPLPGNQVRIVDDLGHEVGERRQGRLEFRGTSATAGYFGNAEKTKALIRDGWHDSGDLAYMSGGNIFITGRVKDIIIKGGRNIYPEEIEQAVGDLEGIRKGCVAVFASADPETGSERLIVVAEARNRDASVREGLQTLVAETVSDILGMPADEVVIAEPHAVPKTSSGKIRRTTTGELYESGNLGTPVRSLWLQVVRLGLLSGLPRLRRARRVVADMAYAAWWWLVLVSGAMATWPAVIILPNRRARWSFVRRAARLVLRLMGVPLKVSGVSVPASEAGVIVVNHSSYLDVAVLAATLPGEPVFVAKSELADQIVAGPFLRRLGARFADRAFVQAGLRDVEAFKDVVLGGQQLVVFPEATFFRMPGLLAFRLGAFSIASAAATPILPVVIRGTRSILRGEQWFPRRGSVEVEFLEPVAPSGSDFDAAVRLRDEVRNVMLTRCGEPDMATHEVVFPRDTDMHPEQ